MLIDALISVSHCAVHIYLIFNLICSVRINIAFLVPCIYSEHGLVADLKDILAFPTKGAEFKLTSKLKDKHA